MTLNGEEIIIPRKRVVSQPAAWTLSPEPGNTSGVGVSARTWKSGRLFYSPRRFSSGGLPRMNFFFKFDDFYLPWQLCRTLPDPGLVPSCGIDGAPEFWDLLKHINRRTPWVWRFVVVPGQCRILLGCGRRALSAEDSPISDEADTGFLRCWPTKIP